MFAFVGMPVPSDALASAALVKQQPNPRARLPNKDKRDDGTAADKNKYYQALALQFKLAFRGPDLESEPDLLFMTQKHRIVFLLRSRTTGPCVATSCGGRGARVVETPAAGGFGGCGGGAAAVVSKRKGGSGGVDLI
eukprot:CAMPEP_0171738856 /NCGR_PEP_ID=MMETSP0991-20121206/33867_1 /TAXON_ID=483369 /ORGANISM="non described non described, Strain CCMP2098" /LENGTH=136 /DNA_ID=CAMNT_0012336323 /DNA_START=418 /DNA_END=828 /DNA_ORIENTATION=+